MKPRPKIIQADTRILDGLITDEQRKRIYIKAWRINERNELEIDLDFRDASHRNTKVAI